MLVLYSQEYKYKNMEKGIVLVSISCIILFVNSKTTKWVRVVFADSVLAFVQ